jgi:hypothetical protein
MAPPADNPAPATALAPPFSVNVPVSPAIVVGDDDGPNVTVKVSPGMTLKGSWMAQLPPPPPNITDPEVALYIPSPPAAHPVTYTLVIPYGIMIVPDVEKCVILFLWESEAGPLFCPYTNL